MNKSELEQEFEWLIKAYKLPEPEREFKFHPTRKWRFDFAWPDKKVAVEIEGGIWIRGGHNRGVGYLKDIEKYNQAVAMDWKVFRMGVKSGQKGLDAGDLELIKNILTKTKGGQNAKVI